MRGTLDRRDRTGKDRTGQDRKGWDRMEKNMYRTESTGQDRSKQGMQGKQTENEQSTDGAAVQ